MTTAQNLDTENTEQLVSPQGPVPTLLNKLQFGRDPLAFFPIWQRRYGTLFKMLNWPIFVLSDAELVEQILITRTHDFVRGFSKEENLKSVKLGGNGLINSTGDYWLRQRRLMQPAFHKEQIKTYGEIAITYTQRFLSSEWQPGQVHDIFKEMLHLTMQVSTKSLFGVDLAVEETEELEKVLSTVLVNFNLAESLVQGLKDFVVTKLIPKRLRGTRYKDSTALMAERIERLNIAVGKIVKGKLEAAAISATANNVSGNKNKDLLSLLIEARDAETGEGMTDQELRDEILTLFIAGHETTAVALTWTWYLLAKHPEVEAKLAAEIRSVLSANGGEDGEGVSGGRNSNDRGLATRAVTIEDLPKLVYTGQVIKEVLRLYPPVWLFPSRRPVVENTKLGKYGLPANSSIMLSTYLIHRDSRYYDEPLVFKPERWTEEMERELPKGAYVPFGTGPRMCIGRAFALQEMTLMLATIAQQYKLELVDAERSSGGWGIRGVGSKGSGRKQQKEVKPSATMTLRPNGAVKLRLQKRDS
jgi:cytochrome P450